MDHKGPSLGRLVICCPCPCMACTFGFLGLPYAYGDCVTRRVPASLCPRFAPQVDMEVQRKLLYNSINFAKPASKKALSEQLIFGPAIGWNHTENQCEFYMVRAVSVLPCVSPFMRLTNPLPAGLPLSITTTIAAGLRNPNLVRRGFTAWVLTRPARPNRDCGLTAYPTSATT